MRIGLPPRAKTFVAIVVIWVAVLGYVGLSSSVLACVVLVPGSGFCPVATGLFMVPIGLVAGVVPAIVIALREANPRLHGRALFVMSLLLAAVSAFVTVIIR